LFFLGEGLDCDHLAVSEPFCEIDSGESTFADLLLGLEELMKVALIDAFFEFKSPKVDDGGVVTCEDNLFLAGFSF
jgi:hypothetical protein